MNMSAHEALSETREINETIPQRIIGIEPEQHRFKKGTIWSTRRSYRKGKRKKSGHPKITIIGSDRYCTAIIRMFRWEWGREAERERSIKRLWIFLHMFVVHLQLGIFTFRRICKTQNCYILKAWWVKIVYILHIVIVSGMVFIII